MSGMKTMAGGVTQHRDARRQQSVMRRGVTGRGGAGLGYALGLGWIDLN